MQQEMESLLEGELVEGEQLIWFGRPDPSGKSIVSPNKVFLILCIVFGIVGVVLLATGWIVLGVAPEPAGGEASIPLFTVGATFAFMAIMFAIFTAVFRFSPKNVLYAITSRRAIILRSGRYLTVDSYGQSDIGQIRRLERADGAGDVLFTKATGPYGYGYGYGNSSYGYNAGTYNNYGMSRQGSFNGIANVRSVEHTLVATFK